MRRVSTFEVEPLSQLLEHVEPMSLVKGACESKTYTQWWTCADAYSFQHEGAKAVVGKRVIWMQHASDLEARQPAAIE
jgi:hypothetical protein